LTSATRSGATTAAYRAGRPGADRAVLAAALGLVQRRVGRGDQGLLVGRAGRHRDAEAGGRANPAAADKRDRHAGDAPANPLGDALGLDQVRTRQHHGQLLAAVPGHMTAVAHGGLDGPRHRAQDLVPALVAVAVVDLLEVVDVDHHEADRRAEPRRTREL
jgi:hypothetical protein